MKIILNFFFFLCAIFLIFSYEAIAGQSIKDNTKKNPSHTQSLPTKKPIKIYPKKVYNMVQLNAPEILSPSNNSTFNHYPRILKLRWKPVSNAIAYNVEIDCLNCCGAGIWCVDADRKFKFIEGLNGNFYQFNFVGAQPGRWRVQAVDANGKWGKQCPWVHFRFTK